MNRQQLEHIIRAAAQIADDDDVVIFGSQAIRRRDKRPGRAESLEGASGAD